MVYYREWNMDLFMVRKETMRRARKATSPNKRVSGFATLRPNPAYGWTSDTHWTLGDICLRTPNKEVVVLNEEKKNIL